MKRFALSTMLAGGIFAGLIGNAGAAHAEHRHYYDDFGYGYSFGYGFGSAPHVDTSVHTRTIIVRH